MVAASTTEPADTAPRKGGRLLRVLMLLLACLAALAVGLVVSVGPDRLMALLPGNEPEVAAPDEGQASGADVAPGGGHAAAGAEGDHIAVTPFKEIIVNITSTTATGRKTTRFLKLNLALAYDSTLAGADNVEARKLFMRDSFQEYLRQLNESDLQGSIGLVRLKAELLRRARVIAESEAPQQFLIADLIIQ